MIQTDRERVAISTAIALLLYAGIFGATGWLDILKPAAPREYFGPLAVEVTLEKPAPQKILPPQKTPAQPAPKPVIEPAAVKPAPQPAPRRGETGW